MFDVLVVDSDVGSCGGCKEAERQRGKETKETKGRESMWCRLSAEHECLMLAMPTARGGASNSMSRTPHGTSGLNGFNDHLLQTSCAYESSTIDQTTYLHDLSVLKSIPSDKMQLQRPPLPYSRHRSMCLCINSSNQKAGVKLSRYMGPTATEADPTNASDDQ